MMVAGGKEHLMKKLVGSRQITLGSIKAKVSLFRNCLHFLIIF